MDSMDSSVQDPNPLPPLSSTLRFPPLLSLSSPFSVGVVESPAVKCAVITCVLSLLRALLRVDGCIEISTHGSQVGRLVRATTSGERKGKGWVGSDRDEGDASSDDSDSELSIE